MKSLLKLESKNIGNILDGVINSFVNSEILIKVLSFLTCLLNRYLVRLLIDATVSRQLSMNDSICSTALAEFNDVGKIHRDYL